MLGFELLQLPLQGLILLFLSLDELFCEFDAGLQAAGGEDVAIGTLVVAIDKALGL